MIAWTNCLALIFCLLSASASSDNIHNGDITELINDHESSTMENIIYPTLRPKRANCTPPLIEQFPQSIISISLQNNRWISTCVHILLAIYAFVNLIIINKYHFLPSVESINEELQYPPSVIGATFMAIGSSVPELSKNIIGIFATYYDIGVSGVFPSSIYNVPYVFIIAICGFCLKTEYSINCWSFFRDSLFYTLSIFGLFYSLIDIIEWWKCLIMLAIYLIYIVMLCFDHILEKWIRSFSVNCCTKSELAQIELSVIGNSNTDEDVLSELAQIELSVIGSSNTDEDVLSKLTKKRDSSYSCENNKVNYIMNSNNRYLGIICKVLKFIFPISFLLESITSSCKNKNISKPYIFTYLISLICLFISSYIMIWMLFIIGNDLKIPDMVMNFTIIFIGLTILGMMNSVVVTMKGFADMAIANAIGYNIFNICVSLGLPWFIETGIFKPGSHISIFTERLPYFVLSTLLTMLMFIMTACLNKMKVDSDIGRALVGLFIIYNTLVYILNTFNHNIVPQCLTVY